MPYKSAFQRKPPSKVTRLLVSPRVACVPRFLEVVLPDRSKRRMGQEPGNLTETEGICQHARWVYAVAAKGGEDESVQVVARYSGGDCPNGSNRRAGVG